MPHVLKHARLMLLSMVAGSLVSACSSTDPFGPSIGLGLHVTQPAALPSTLRVEIGSSSASLHADAPSGNASTRMHVIGYGEKLIQLTLLGAQSDTLATASFSESLQAGYDYGIGAVVSRVRPLGNCVAIVSATPLRNSPSDTLFVENSGIPKGAVC